MTIDQAIDAAMEHHRAGRLREAEAIYQQILTQNPDYPDALNLLGALASQMGNQQVAVELLSRAIQSQPNAVDYYLNLGHALSLLGNKQRAADVYRAALRLAPGQTDIYNTLADLLDSLGQYDQAIELLQRAIASGAVSPEVYYNLGNSLRLAGRVGEAQEAYRRAIQLRPNFAQAHSNLAKTFQDAGQVQECIAEFRHAIAIDPNWALPHYDLALALLTLGEYEQGWQEYEWRYRSRDIGIFCYDFPQPRWDGGPLEGRRILIHSEQGFGDTIQFCRYLAKVADERSGQVIFQCQPEVAEQVRSLGRSIQVITRSEALPEFDVHCPLLSLPLLLRNDWKIPAEIPYITADAQRVEQWRSKLADETRLKVGLVWAGKPEHKNDHKRSMPASEFAPLNQISHARFFSLQKGDAAQQLADLSSQLDVTDFTNDLNDFVDTAALIQNLDLVITVDTAVAHLAGAIGKPIWVLLPFIADWRWLLNRDDSPWYPMMRLFRQKTPGAWGPVIAEVAAALLARSFREATPLGPQ